MGMVQNLKKLFHGNQNQVGIMSLPKIKFGEKELVRQ
jgi:hypothetical protein